MLRWVAILMTAALMATLAACGGGDDDTTSAPQGELSRSELVAEGDAICQEASDRFAQAREAPPTTAEESATFTQGLIDITEDQVSRLRALDPPASLEPAMKRYLAALEANIATLREGLAAAEQNDATAYAEAQAKAVEGQVERLRLAQAVGFRTCSRPAGGGPAAG
jgi:predicted transcriptional regulator